MTVLNPLSQVDELIMDDADLAGPAFYCFCFGICLLLVSNHSRNSQNCPIHLLSHSQENRISIISTGSPCLAQHRCTLC